jgi:hypothetical protein
MLFQFNFPFTASGGLPHVAANRPRIRPGPLAARRQPPRVPETAIRLQIFEPLDILAHHLPQLSFYPAVRFDPILDPVHLVRRKCLCALRGINLRRDKRPRGLRPPDAIKIGQRDISALLIRNINAE